MCEFAMLGRGDLVSRSSVREKIDLENLLDGNIRSHTKSMGELKLLTSYLVGSILLIYHCLTVHQVPDEYAT